MNGALLLPLLLCAAPPGFWERWGDGRAELNGYTLVQQRYGEERRKAHAVIVYVTETFSESARLKVDGPPRAPGDAFPVLKVNINERFQTGVYDYAVMTSAFVRLEDGHGMRAGAPVKLAFSAQEWCGHVFDGLWFHADGSATRRLHSYFDGEGDVDARVMLEGAFTADELFAAVRGLGRPLPDKGEIMLVPRLKELRLLHRPLVAQPARVERLPARALTVPAGTFAAEEVRFTRKDGTVHRFFVEVAAPRRLLGWEVTGQEKGELAGTVRDAYWDHHREGDEALLHALGLGGGRWDKPRASW